MAQNKTSNSNENYFARYKSQGIEAKNRERKLRRQLKLQPGNAEQINLAIKNIHHRRKVPKTREWSSTLIRTAMLFKYFSGKFSKGTHTKKKVEDAQPDLIQIVSKPEKRINTPKPVSMFSLESRAKVGVL